MSRSGYWEHALAIQADFAVSTLQELSPCLSLLSHLKLAPCMQVLAASVVDMLQAGIHQQQPDRSDEPAAATGLDQPSPEASGTAAAAQGSSQASATAAAPPDAAGPNTSAPQSAERASQQAAEPALERSCIFEVEVVLTAKGTKLTPSISQFLVGIESSYCSGSQQCACPLHKM